MNPMEIRRQVQGIALILFGWMLCTMEKTHVDPAFLKGLERFPFPLLGICVAAAGLVLVFRKENDN